VASHGDPIRARNYIFLYALGAQPSTLVDAFLQKSISGKR
jgi:hypothetical protein